MVSSRCRAALVAVIIAALLTPVHPALAQVREDPGKARMRRAMHAYFEGEKREGWAFGAGGLLTTSGGGAMFLADDGFYRGAAYPLVIVGAVELAVGVMLLVRTDAQVRALDERLDTGRRAFLAIEQPRMEKVRSEFAVLAGLELALLAAGLGIATYGSAQRDHTVSGIGAGVALQSAAMFTFDIHASARANAYAAALDAFRRLADR